MPLTWNMEAVTDYKELNGDEYEWAVTQSLIFFSMTIATGEINEANAADWYAAVHLWEKVNGPLTYKDGQQRYLEPSDIRRRIGLRTNGGGTGVGELRKQVRRLQKEWLDDARYEYERAEVTA